jgi:hypothetical protein
MSTIDISLTTLIDFVGKSGTPRLTCVREARARYDEEYHPAKDYWRGLRNGIVGAHQPGGSIDDLAALPSRVAESKAAPYAQGVAGYRRFLGRKSVSWFEPHAGEWMAHGLKVRLNPELGLVVDGVPFHVKLYLKQEPLRRVAVQPLLHLLGHVAPGPFGATPLVVDVQRGKPFVPDARTSRVGPLMAGEAAAFAAMWRDLDRAA